jgi:hypothetical protein
MKFPWKSLWNKKPSVLLNRFCSIISVLTSQKQIFLNSVSIFKQGRNVVMIFDKYVINFSSYILSIYSVIATILCMKVLATQLYTPDQQF